MSDHTWRALENSHIFNFIVTPINILKFSFFFLFFFESEVPMNFTICLEEKKGLELKIN